MSQGIEEKLAEIWDTHTGEETRKEVYDYESSREEHDREKVNVLRQKAKEHDLRNTILEKFSTALDKEQKSRSRYSVTIFCIVLVYLLVALLIVLFNGRFWFTIDNKVLMVLVGSTSINVIGLLAIVLKFVFTNHHHKILDKSSIER